MPTTGTPNGEIYRLEIGGDKIGHATSSGVEITTATQEVSSKDTGGGAYTETVAAKISWSFSGEMLFNLDASISAENRLTFEDLRALVHSRALVTAKISTGVTGDVEYSGSVLITSLSSTFPNDEVATASFTLTGSGELASATIA